MKKILLVGEYGAINGGENSLMAILPSLQEVGFSFHALVPPESNFSAALQCLQVSTSPFEPGSGPTRKSQDEIRQDIAAVMGQVQPDLVHANSLSTGRLCGSVCAERNVKSIGYLRDIIGLSKKAVSDINQLDRIIAVSDATREFHIQQGMTAEKIVTIRNGVDLLRFYPATDSVDADSIRDQLNISANSLLLLYVGQIGMRKGLDTLLDAFSILQARFENLHLAIAGIRHSQKAEAIEYEHKLHQQCRAFTERVHWLGRRTDIPQLMRAATLLMHAAKQEPLGRVLLEASATGLPIAATNVGGTLEILGPTPGFPFPHQLTCEQDQPQELANIAAQLLESPENYERVSQRLRESAETRFAITRCAAELAESYEQILAAPNHAN